MTNDYYIPPQANTDLVLVTCHICHDKAKPVKCVVPGEDERFREEVERVANGAAVHNHCLDAYHDALKAKQFALFNEKKMASWDVMCPKNFRQPINARFKGYNAQKEEAVCRWIYDACGLLLIGPSGRCKSRFAWKILQREFDGGKTVGGWTHSDFRMTITALASAEMVQATNFCTKLARLDLLLLDDLGKGRRTPASEEALFTIIDARAREMRPTIYTMNTALQVFAAQLSEEYREPILRRITEHTARIDF